MRGKKLCPTKNQSCPHQAFYRNNSLKMNRKNAQRHKIRLLSNENSKPRRLVAPLFVGVYLLGLTGNKTDRCYKNPCDTFRRYVVSTHRLDIYFYINDKKNAEHRRGSCPKNLDARSRTQAPQNHIFRVAVWSRKVPILVRDLRGVQACTDRTFGTSNSHPKKLNNPFTTPLMEIVWSGLHSKGWRQQRSF